MRKVVLLNATEPGEIRVAILENNELAEIFMERKSHGQQAGNIYKGRVVNVEPSLQAAFVDLGAERNGFLHASDCIPPDGGYSDVVTKLPPRGNRDGRDNRNNQNRQSSQSQSSQQQPARVEPPTPAPVASSAENVQPAPAGVTAMPAGQPVTAAVVPTNGQPVFNGGQGNNKRRRRRRGGRGRSGRGRPMGPAPMLAPAPGQAPAAVSTPAAQENVPAQTTDAAPQTPAAQPSSSSETPAPVSAVENEIGLPPSEADGRGNVPPTAAPSADISEGTGGTTDEDDFDDDLNAAPEADVPPAVTSAEDADDANSSDEDDGEDDEEDALEGTADSTEAISAAPVQDTTPAHDDAAPSPAASAEEMGTAQESLSPSTGNAQDVAQTQPDESANVKLDEAADLDTASAERNPIETLHRRGTDIEENFAQEMGVPEPENAGSAEAETDSSEAETDSSEEASGGPADVSDSAAVATETAASAGTEVAAQAMEALPIPAPGQPAPVLAPREQHRGGGRSGRERPHDRRYTIQEMLREGQEVLIQVAKEGIGQKGPALTTYISIPGRYLVLMPAVQRLGVSKRIENEEQRRALKDALAQINPPDDMGVIVRTAGTGRSKDELQRDMNYLMNVWENMKKKARVTKAPNLIYQEGDVVTRVFRDVITDDVTEIVIDDPVVLERAREFVRETSPGNEHKLKLYSDAEPLFHKYGVEQQLQRLFNRKVNLRSGGSIVIEQTEALVAIDVNTGRFREKRNQDDTILQTNLEAAREIARQLRLRDIGGLVMIDFIDMEIHEHRRRVERELKSHLARDKARINVLPVSMLGVVEMTRQRVRHSLRKTLFERCPHCSGSGHIKSSESVGLEMLRELKSQLKDKAVKRVKVLLNSVVAFAILNQFRKDLVRMEEAHGITIEVCGDPVVSLSQMQVSTAKEGGEWILKKVSEVDDYVRNS